eukprot:1159041-Pelagomonas_calceolata.AAC.5
MYCRGARRMCVYVCVRSEKKGVGPGIPSIGDSTPPNKASLLIGFNTGPTWINRLDHPQGVQAAFPVPYSHIQQCSISVTAPPQFHHPPAMTRPATAPPSSSITATVVGSRPDLMYCAQASSKHHCFKGLKAGASTMLIDRGQRHNTPHAPNQLPQHMRRTQPQEGAR